MAGEALITVVGNLGADPEIKFLPDGTAVCNLRVANEERKLVDGEWKTVRTNWYKVAVWKSQGEAVAEHATKGSRVVVVGRLTFDEYEKDGATRLVPEITAEAVGLVPKPAPKIKSQQVEDDGSPF